MEFISKYDTTFITSVSRKYGKRFKTFEEYSLFLYELQKSDKDYYYKLEEDIKEFSDYQTERKYNNGKTQSQTKKPR